MATIRKRGGKWQVQVRRKGFDPISRSFNLKSDADEWARHIERQADRRELPADHRRLKEITVRDVLERYRDTVVIRKRAKDVETIIIDAILRQPFVALPLSDVEPNDFSAYRDARLRRVKPTTIWSSP
jgi:hypothetical protein